MTVREDVGEIVLSTTVIGETALPISVDVSITGTASEMQGLFSFQFLLIVNLLVSLFGGFRLCVVYTPGHYEFQFWKISVRYHFSHY